MNEILATARRNATNKVRRVAGIAPYEVVPIPKGETPDWATLQAIEARGQVRFVVTATEIQIFKA